MATITSTQTGDWTAVGTWVGGVVPDDGDDVVVDTGHTVTFDTTDTATVTCDNLTLDGTLNFTAGKRTMRVNGITTIGNPGLLDVGAGHVFSIICASEGEHYINYVDHSHKYMNIVGAEKTSATITAVAADESTLTDTGSTFSTDGVDTDCYIMITSGYAKQRVYKVLSVDSETQLTVDSMNTTADTLTSIATNVLNLDTGGLDIDKHIIRYVKFDTSGNQYLIVDNDAASLTLMEKPAATESDTDTITINDRLVVGDTFVVFLPATLKADDPNFNTAQKRASNYHEDATYNYAVIQDFGYGTTAALAHFGYAATASFNYVYFKDCMYYCEAGGRPSINNVCMDTCEGGFSSINSTDGESYRTTHTGIRMINSTGSGRALSSFCSSNTNVRALIKDWTCDRHIFSGWGSIEACIFINPDIADTAIGPTAIKDSKFYWYSRHFGLNYGNAIVNTDICIPLDYVTIGGGSTRFKDTYIYGAGTYAIYDNDLASTVGTLSFEDCGLGYQRDDQEWGMTSALFGDGTTYAWQGEWIFNNVKMSPALTYGASKMCDNGWEVGYHNCARYQDYNGAKEDNRIYHMWGYTARTTGAGTFRTTSPAIKMATSSTSINSTRPLYSVIDFPAAEEDQIDVSAYCKVKSGVGYSATASNTPYMKLEGCGVISTGSGQTPNTDQGNWVECTVTNRIATRSGNMKLFLVMPDGDGDTEVYWDDITVTITLQQ